MDANHFDALARSLDPGHRRRLFAALAGVTLGTITLGPGFSESEAKKKRKKKRKKNGGTPSCSSGETTCPSGYPEHCCPEGTECCESRLACCPL